MVLDDSWWFLVVLDGSWWFLMVLGGSLKFKSGSLWFLVVPCSFGPF